MKSEAHNSGFLLAVVVVVVVMVFIGMLMLVVVVLCCDLSEPPSDLFGAHPQV